MRHAALMFACAIALVACSSSDPDRPPAASSGGSSASSGGGSSSGSTSNDGGGSSSGTDGGSSSGSVDGGGSSIAAGLRASIDNGAREFTDAAKASRQSGGYEVEVSGKDSFGNELRITLTNTGANVAAGSYDCSGGAGSTYGNIAYVVTGGVATWSAAAPGECTVTVVSVDNQVGGTVIGTFSGTAKRAASTDYLITKGQFRLTLE